MKQVKNNKATVPLKKLFIKLCRILGFEIIDQSNFSVPTLNKKINENLSKFSVKSITLPLGEIEITRKILSLDIIVKTCTSVNLVSQNKKRIFEKEKSEYTFRTIKSLVNSINYAKLTINKINFRITIIDHNSKKEDLSINNKRGYLNVVNISSNKVFN